MDELEFGLGKLRRHRLSTAHYIAPVIYRLAGTQKAWRSGTRSVDVEFRPAVRGVPREVRVRLSWDLAELSEEYGFDGFREELRKLKASRNEDDITELAALGTAFALVTVLLPKDRITRVTQKGARGDFYLNGRDDEMIEVSGTVRGQLDALFNKKKRQILLNVELARALVSVSRFESARSRLERVK